MASSDQYRRWIDETRKEQRILRNNGCYRAARSLDSDIRADHCSMMRERDREEREAYHERVYGRDSDRDD